MDIRPCHFIGPRRARNAGASADIVHPLRRPIWCRRALPIAVLTPSPSHSHQASAYPSASDTCGRVPDEHSGKPGSQSVRRRALIDVGLPTCREQREKGPHRTTPITASNAANSSGNSSRSNSNEGALATSGMAGAVQPQSAAAEPYATVRVSRQQRLTGGFGADGLRGHMPPCARATSTSADVASVVLCGAVAGFTGLRGCRCRRCCRGLFSIVPHALPAGGGGGLGLGLGVGVVVGGGGGGRIRRVFLCSKCGARHGQYHGKCGKCGGFGTIDRDGVVEEPVTPAAAAAGPVAGGRGSGGGGGAGVQALERVQLDAAAATAAAIAAVDARVQSYSDDGTGGSGGGVDVSVDSRKVGWVAGGSGGLDDVPLSLRALSRMGALEPGGWSERIPLSGRTGAEVQRVLGGGVVPGALVLFGGDPGVGKSTLTLQIAAMMAHPEIDFDALEEQRPSDDEYGGEYGDEDEQRGDDDDAGADGSTAGGEGDGIGFEFSAVPANQGGPDGWRQMLYDAAGGGTAGGGSAAATDSLATAVAPPPPPLPPSRTVLYVTAEETREQVVARSRRMGLKDCDRVVVLCRSEMSAISRAVLQLRPDAVVMDSINTVYLSNLPQAPGTVTQIRECGQLLLRLAKDHRVAVFIIGHVTKGGEMAGPNMLAHMVDTVLYLEGDVAQSVRLLRVVKNRHGSDAECGVFSMDGSGLHAVANHSALFLENRLAEASLGGGRKGEREEDGGASSVVGVTLQGSRAILVEVQALVSPLSERAALSSSALSYRSATGVDKLRLANLCAILDKHVPTLELSACSVIVNVVGGAQVRDVASDLALAVAIASSYYNAPVPRDLAVCGEVDLAGRIRRSFQRLDVRLREAAKLGFRKVIIPQTKGWERLARDPQLRGAGVTVVAVRSVAEALREALGPDVAGRRPPHIKPPPRGKPPFGTGPPGSRFSRRNRTAPGEAAAAPSPPPSVGTDGSWPRAAARGGAAAAYAAAATAPLPPLPGSDLLVDGAPGASDAYVARDGDYIDTGALYGSVVDGSGNVMYDMQVGVSGMALRHGGWPPAEPPYIGSGDGAAAAAQGREFYGAWRAVSGGDDGRAPEAARWGLLYSPAVPFPDGDGAWLSGAAPLPNPDGLLAVAKTEYGGEYGRGTGVAGSAEDGEEAQEPSLQQLRRARRRDSRS